MNPEELRQRLTLIIAETPVNQCWTLSTVHLLKLVEDAVEAEREDCALICENMERNGAWITKAEAASAIRANRSQATPSVFISNRGEKAKPAWHCPLKKPDCKENCGSYGCGN